MKLISCHIENFGNLSLRDISFTDGIYTVCEHNGYGKTTLASFLKAMLYGMSGYKSNSKDRGDRAHFYPQNGGKFGGNLIFTYGGSEYRIERFFGKTSEKDDSLFMYRDNKEYDRQGKKPGVCLFGVDKEAFERIIYITSDEITLSSSDSIRAKLQSVIGGYSEGEGFSAALKTITEEEKEYKAARGNGGKISDLSNRIASLRAQIADKTSECSRRSDYYKESENVKSCIEKLEKEHKNAAYLAKLRGEWETYDALVASCKEYEEKLSSYDEKYPFGYPDDSITEDMESKANELHNFSINLKNKAFSAEKQTKLAEFQRKYGNTLPDDSSLGEIQSNINSRSQKRSEINIYNSGKASGRFEELSTVFSRGIPDDDMLLKIQLDADELVKLRSSQQPLNKQSDKPNISNILIISAVLLVIGAVLSFVLLPLGIAVLAAAVAFFAIRMVSYSSAKKKYENEEETARSAEQNRINAINSGESVIKAFLVSYNCHASGDVVLEYGLFKKDVAEYKELKKNIEEKDSIIKKADEELSDLKNKLGVLFDKYGISINGREDYQTLYNNLVAEITEYKGLMKDKEALEKDAAELQQKISELTSTLCNFTEKYKITVLGGDYQKAIAQLKSDKGARALLENVRLGKKKETEEYKAEKNLISRPDSDMPDIDRINRELSEKRLEQTRLESAINEVENATVELEEKQNELKDAECLLGELKHNHKLLDAAQKCLTRADENLRTKYISPISDAFKKYAIQLEKAIGETVSMDDKLSVKVERSGVLISEESLSKGEKCICMLCFRLALIDNMFEGEKPLLILDDPFTALDQSHIERALQTLLMLAKDRQIIYFTCHESRVINSYMK